MEKREKPNGRVIGLVGPSGSGKSTVSGLMGRWGGVFTVDADAVAHRVMAEDASCLKKLREAYGGEVVTSAGLDRKKLAEIVFHDGEKLRVLGEITYPFIIAACRDEMDSHFAAGARAVILDAPTLFESGAQWLCDDIVAVVMPREERIRRIVARDHIPREAAEARLSHQFADGYYTDRSAFVIKNDGDLRHLEDEVERCRLFLKL